MKESITKFDLEAAFKALDEIETAIPSKGLKANKPALTEIFSNKSKFDALFEEYYDISNTDELAGAKEERESEVAKAKLARIEKIVDLDADSPEDLLPSYVGKYIIQCPQCMTLFYKNPEDVEESEEDATIVNVTQVCQHCGNDSGYSLIGKVGAATEEPTEMQDNSADLDELNGEVDIDLENDEGFTDENSDEAQSSAETGDSEEFDLDEISFEDDEEATEEDTEDKKEESHFIAHTGESLVEDFDSLLEAAESEISSAEFKELISSPEFKKPISDQAVRAMLKDLDESTFEDDNIVDDNTLAEGGLGLLAKTVKKKLGQVGKQIKNNAADAIDKFANNTMTREEKADWILASALENSVKEVKFDSEGKVVADPKSRKFNTFAVIGYKNQYANGKPITLPPSIEDTELVPDMDNPQARNNYKMAEELAKGLSQRQGSGPAAIYLAKNASDPNMAFLCFYSEGKVVEKEDQLEKYFNIVKQDLEGKALINQSGGVWDKQQAKELTADKVKLGDRLVAGDDIAEVTEVTKSKYQTNGINFKLKNLDGSTESLSLAADAKVSVITAEEGTANESFSLNLGSLETIMESIDSVDDRKLEKLLSHSLIKSYENVAGFKLTECLFENSSFKLNGKILFESGNIRNTSYVITKADRDENTIAFSGLNEGLNVNKYFKLTGKTGENKVFIAEDFQQTK